MSPNSELKSALLILNSWNASHGPLFQIRECDLIWNFSQQDWVQYQVSEILGTPIVFATASVEGIKNGLSEKSLWLSLWAEIPEGKECLFINGLLDLAKTKNKTRAAIGADEFHFLPGIPTYDLKGQRLVDAIKSVGFEGDSVIDFLGSLQQPTVKKYVQEGLSQSDDMVFASVSEVHFSQMDRFMQTEFAGRWSREFKFWGERKDTRRAQWFSLSRSQEEIIGFARLAKRGTHSTLTEGWTPSALRLAMNDGFSATDGCLGPIGVAKKYRGQGMGKVLLSHVLKALEDLGAEQICVDWTDAIQYYSSLGFIQARNYRTAWKSGSL